MRVTQDLSSTRMDGDKMNMSEHIRLSLLEEELRPTIRTIDESDDRFDFTRTKGPDPKLWIDMTSYVTMGKDQRTYRFQKDSSMGLIVLAETSDVKKTASIISEYVAEQVSERDKMMKEEWSSFAHLDDEIAEDDTATPVILTENEPNEKHLENSSTVVEEGVEPEVLEPVEDPEPIVEEQPHSEIQPQKRSILGGLIWFFIGLLVFLVIIATALFLGAPDAY